MKAMWLAIVALPLACAVPCQARVGACSESFDLYAECNASTLVMDSLVLGRYSASPALPSTVCVDKRTALSDLKILNVTTQKIGDAGDLAVLATIDSARSLDLLEFSKRYIGRNMVMVKQGKVLRVAALRSLLPNGSIASGVVDQGDADGLRDAIRGKCGLQGR